MPIQNRKIKLILIFLLIILSISAFSIVGVVLTFKLKEEKTTENPQAASVWDFENGVISDPTDSAYTTYLIGSKKALKNFATSSNNVSWDMGKFAFDNATVQLTNDIDCEDETISITHFAGVFDGQNHTISFIKFKEKI